MAVLRRAFRDDEPPTQEWSAIGMEHTVNVEGTDRPMRVVAGSNGSMYWNDDHDYTLMRVVEEVDE